MAAFSAGGQGIFRGHNPWPLTGGKNPNGARFRWGHNLPPRGRAPAERAIDGPPADAAALLCHYTRSDDDINQILARGIIR